MRTLIDICRNIIACLENTVFYLFFGIAGKHKRIAFIGKFQNDGHIIEVFVLLKRSKHGKLRTAEGIFTAGLCGYSFSTAVFDCSQHFFVGSRCGSIVF